MHAPHLGASRHLRQVTVAPVQSGYGATRSWQQSTGYGEVLFLEDTDQNVGRDERPSPVKKEPHIRGNSLICDPEMYLKGASLSSLVAAGTGAGKVIAP